jgi:PAS domain S-box-containing protein
VTFRRSPSSRVLQLSSPLAKGSEETRREDLASVGRIGRQAPEPSRESANLSSPGCYDSNVSVVMVGRTSSLTRRVTIGSLAIAISGILCTGSSVYYTSYEAITDLGTSEMTRLVETTMNMIHQVSDQAVINNLRAVAERNLEIVSHIHAEYKRGRTTEAEAKALSASILLSQHIGASGYIYCIDSTGVMRVHPKSSLVGTNMGAHMLFRQQVSKKHGYIEYSWQNPGESAARPKALYMSYFEPWDWIVSVSSYREEFYQLVSAKDFRDDLLGIRLGESGYLYIMDGKGTVVIQPTMEGANQVNIVDSRGHHFVSEMLERKNGSIRYWWQDPGGSHPREKLAIYRYNARFDWIVASSVYVDELYHPLKSVKLVVAIVLSVTVVLALFLSVLFGRRVVAAEEAARSALQASLQTTQTIIDKVPFALILLDRDLTIRRANEAAGRSLGLDPAMLTGRNWRDFVPKGSDGSCDSLLSVGRPGEGEEVDVINADGALLSILRTVIPIVIDGKEIYIQAFLDLSERKRLEGELQESRSPFAIAYSIPFSQPSLSAKEPAKGWPSLVRSLSKSTAAN